MPSSEIVSSSTSTISASVCGSFHWIGPYSSLQGSSSASSRGSNKPVAFASSTVMPTCTGPMAPGAATSFSTAGSDADGESPLVGPSFGSSDPLQAPTRSSTARTSPVLSLIVGAFR